jgi:uncharacterized coiled-coil protein SlyX
MADDMITKPTIETILERMTASAARFEQRFDQLEKRSDERFNHLEKRFDQLEKSTGERFDKLENEIDTLSMVVSSTRTDMSKLRLEFREWRTQLKEAPPIPQSN